MIMLSIKIWIDVILDLLMIMLSVLCFKTDSAMFRYGDYLNIDNECVSSIVCIIDNAWTRKLDGYEEELTFYKRGDLFKNQMLRQMAKTYMGSNKERRLVRMAKKHRPVNAGAVF